VASNVGPYGLFWQPALVRYSSILYLCVYWSGKYRCLLSCLPGALVGSSMCTSVRLRTIVWKFPVADFYEHLAFFLVGGTRNQSTWARWLVLQGVTLIRLILQSQTVLPYTCVWKFPYSECLLSRFWSNCFITSQTGFQVVPLCLPGFTT